MTAIALKGGRSATGALATTLARTPQDLSWLRDELIRDGDVYSPNRGYVALAVPMFAWFLLANYEAARELSDAELLALEDMARNQQAFRSRHLRDGWLPVDRATELPSSSPPPGLPGGSADHGGPDPRPPGETMMWARRICFLNRGDRRSRAA